jgi:hypothetical protein
MSFPQERHVLEHERHADGRDQRREPGGAPQRSIGHPIDGHVEGGGGQHGEREDERQQRHEVPAVQRPGHAEQGEPGEGDVEAQHEDVAVREVDQLDDAVDHRVAERDQGEDGAAGQPVDRLLDQDFPPGHVQSKEASTAPSEPPPGPLARATMALEAER